MAALTSIDVDDALILAAMVGREMFTVANKDLQTGSLTTNSRLSTQAGFIR